VSGCVNCKCAVLCVGCHYYYTSSFKEKRLCIHALTLPAYCPIPKLLETAVNLPVRSGGRDLTYSGVRGFPHQLKLVGQPTRLCVRLLSFIACNLLENLTPRINIARFFAHSYNNQLFVRKNIQILTQMTPS
jgi:hypothetical protein